MDVMRWARAEWDRILGFTCIGLGALAVILGYLGVSGSNDVIDALSYLVSAGVGGLFLLGVGGVLLISADLHDEWRKLERVERALTGRDIDLSKHQNDDIPVDDGSSNGSPSPRSLGGRIDQPSPETAIPMLATAAEPVRLTQPTRLSAGIGLLLALVTILFGWAHTAYAEIDARAVDGASIAAGGLLLGSLAAALSTMRAKRMIQRRKSRLLSQFSAEDGTPGPVSALSASAADGKVLVAEGLSRYHRTGCRTLHGVRAEVVDREEIPSGLRPCGLCGAE